MEYSIEVPISSFSKVMEGIKFSEVQILSLKEGKKSNIEIEFVGNDEQFAIISGFMAA